MAFRSTPAAGNFAGFPRKVFTMSNCCYPLASAARTLSLSALLGLGALLPVSAQTYVYSLNNTFAPVNGGPSLTPNGGTLSASGYTFAPNQGLSLSNAFGGSDYSIDMTFSLTDLGGYRKLLDFNGLNDDAGLYFLNGSLDFYPVADGLTTVGANQSVTVDLTRNGATQLVTGSVNGVPQFSFVDSSGLAVFKSAGDTIHFFEDDNATGMHEASGGTVTGITVSGTSSPVPEASTTVSLGLLLTLGLGGVAIATRKRKAA